MSWICHRCETENPDSVDVCEVCDAQAPRINSFIYDRVINDDSTVIRWNAECCDRVVIVYREKQYDVTDMNSYKLEIESFEDEAVQFLLSSDVTDDRRFSFVMHLFRAPIIEFSADKLKLKRGEQTSIVLSWRIYNASSSVLRSLNETIRISDHGTKTVFHDTACEYTIEATALDGETLFSKQVSIKVFDECEIEFEAEKYFVFPSVPVKLSWNVKHAKKVWLDSAEVKTKGSKTVKPVKNSTYTIKAEDEFGIKEEQIEIQMLPIPQVKSILVPTPTITNNMAINVKQPRYNVNVKFPKINMPLVDTEVPHVPKFPEMGLGVDIEPPQVASLTDLGLNVELSPPLPRFSLKESIKKVFNHIKNKDNEKH